MKGKLLIEEKSSDWWLRLRYLRLHFDRLNVSRSGTAVAIDRKMTLERLVVQDYSEGPLEEKLYGGSDMWVFGKQIKTKEVYIKISLGAHGSSVICISFHIAEHTMNYPLK